LRIERVGWMVGGRKMGVKGGDRGGPLVGWRYGRIIGGMREWLKILLLLIMLVPLNERRKCFL